jgi:uncharacterized protein with GYD domain
MFGVIVCPRCNRVCGVDLGTKSKRCPACGHRIEVSKAKVYFKTDSQEELAEAVRRLADEIAPPLDKGLGSKEKREAPTARSKLDEVGLRMVTVMLTRRHGEFDIDDLAEEMGDVKREQLESIVRKMLSAGLIYEPSPGKYRSV